MKCVFPTPVGVFPAHDYPCRWPARLPHARGGVSKIEVEEGTKTTSSPRPWGCFSKFRLTLRFSIVFPTPVGVFLSGVVSIRTSSGLPHARGGVSLLTPPTLPVHMSSPRPWGCFSRARRYHCFVRVFPTPVGVFLRDLINDPILTSLPHARGGVSDCVNRRY